MKRIANTTIAAGFLFVLITQPARGSDSDDFYIAEPPWFALRSINAMDDSEDIIYETYKSGVRLSIMPNARGAGLTGILISRNDWIFSPAALGEKTHRVQVRIGTDKAEYWEWDKSGGEYEHTNRLVIIRPQATYDRLKCAETFTIRLTPMSGSSKTIVFPISGLAEAEDLSRWKRYPTAEGAFVTDDWEALDSLVDDGVITEDIKEMYLEWDTWWQVEESFLIP